MTSPDSLTDCVATDLAVAGRMQVERSDVEEALASWVSRCNDTVEDSRALLHCARSIWGDGPAFNYTAEAFTSDLVQGIVFGRIYPSLLVNINPGYRRWAGLDISSGQCMNIGEKWKEVIAIREKRPVQSLLIDCIRASFFCVLFDKQFPFTEAAVLLEAEDVAEVIEHVREQLTGGPNDWGPETAYGYNQGIWYPGMKRRPQYQQEAIAAARQLIGPSELTTSSGRLMLRMYFLASAPTPGSIYHVVRYDIAFCAGAICEISATNLATIAGSEELVTWPDTVAGPR